MAPLLLLGGCGIDQLLLGRPSAPAPPERLTPPRSSEGQADLGAGLAPLPTPQQVLTAVPFGRPDPFAPLPAPVISTAIPAGTAASGSAAAAGAPSAAGRPAAAGATATPGSPPRLVQPEGFRLTGVIRSGGRAEALVSYGTLSGSLRPGDRGGRSTALLPPGWALTAIQFGGPTPQDPPSITLQRGTQKLTVKL